MEDVSHQITRIETQKRDENRVSIYLDGAFAFGLEREVVVRHHLHEGDEISETTIDDVLLSEERARAKEKALSYLNYRPRSKQELRSKLRDKNFSERSVNRVIADFLRVGLLDDRQFASTYAQSRMIHKPMGKRLLHRELKSKGIDEEIADAAIDEAYGERSEFDVARELVRKRMGRSVVKNEALQKKKKQLSDFLFRRGFDWNVIAEVLREELSEE